MSDLAGADDCSSKDNSPLESLKAGAVVRLLRVLQPSTAATVGVGAGPEGKKTYIR